VFQNAARSYFALRTHLREVERRSCILNAARSRFDLDGRITLCRVATTGADLESLAREFAALAVGWAPAPGGDRIPQRLMRLIERLGRVVVFDSDAALTAAYNLLWAADDEETFDRALLALVTPPVPELQ